MKGDWGLGMGDWGLGIGPNPQSPIPNPQSPIPNFFQLRIIIYVENKNIKKIYIYFIHYLPINESNKFLKSPLVLLMRASYKLVSYNCL